jgi:hypothetical protein
MFMPYSYRSLLAAFCVLTISDSSIGADGMVSFDKNYTKMLCSYDLWDREKYFDEPCQLHRGTLTNNSGRKRYFQWRGRSGWILTFAGNADTPDGWSFGTLNGKPAVGHKLNRNNYNFGVRDHSAEFSAWIRGYEN